MKKVFILIIVLLLSLSMFGCNNNNNEPIIINIWTYYNDSDITTFDNFVEEFNETVGLEKGIAVAHKAHGTVSSSEKALKASINKDPEAADFPDIFQVYGDTLTALDLLNDSLYGNYISLPFDDYFTTDEFSDFNQGYLNDGRIYNDDKVRILPISKSTEVFMVNKTDWDIFKDENDFTDSDLSTIEGIVRVSKVYYETQNGKAFYSRDSYENEFYNAIKSFGKNVFVTDSNGITTYNKSEAEIPFRAMYDNYFVPYAKGYFDHKEKYRSGDIKDGLIITAVGSISGIKSFPEKVSLTSTTTKEIEGSFFSPPIFEGGGKYAISQGGGFALANTGNEKKVNASIEFLKYASTPTNNARISAALGYLPAVGDVSYDDIKSNYILDKLDKEGLANTSENQSIIENMKVYANELKSYDVTVNSTLVNYTLHSQKPFDTLNSVRNLLKNCIWTQNAAIVGFTNADSIRSMISEAVNNGESKSEATERLLQTYNFTYWFNALSEEIEKVIN